MVDFERARSVGVGLAPKHSDMKLRKAACVDASLPPGEAMHQSAVLCSLSKQGQFAISLAAHQVGGRGAGMRLAGGHWGCGAGCQWCICFGKSTTFDGLGTLRTAA